MQRKNDEIDSIEELQSSLIQLTTHFAQVQFQLKQIANAPAENQQDLIKKLEKFAFSDLNLLEGETLDGNLLKEITEKHKKQKFLIKKLKYQMKEIKVLGDLAEEQKLNVNFNPNLQLKKQISDLQSQISILNRKQKKKISLLDLFLEKTFTFLLSLIQFSFVDCCKNKSIIDHWGYLRAQMELSIVKLEDLLKKPNQSEILFFVRNNLTTTIQNLLQHGTTHQTHAWEIVSKYYQINNGNAYNANFKRKLSQSFNLDLAGAITTKTNLYCVIEDIISSYSQYKRSYNAHFKALICAGLNAKNLALWLNLIFHCPNLVQEYYQTWSYVASTRFNDGLASLEIFSKYDFDLPVDLDIRRFKIVDDIFA